MSHPEDPLRAAILHELFAAEEAEDGEEIESPFNDIPGVWLDELQGLEEIEELMELGGEDEPVVVLDPRIYYGDTWSPPLLDELFFSHQMAAFSFVDEGEA